MTGCFAAILLHYFQNVAHAVLHFFEGLKIFSLFYSPYQDPKDYANKALPLQSPGPHRKKSTVFRVDSHNDREEISPSSPADAVEYFFASDASAIIEHTDRYTYF